MQMVPGTSSFLRSLNFHVQQYHPIQQSDRLRLSTPFLHQPFPMQPAITQAEPQLNSLTHLQTPPIQTEPLSLQTPMKQTTQLPNHLLQRSKPHNCQIHLL